MKRLQVVIFHATLIFVVIYHIEATPTACETPGFYLSQDKEWCFSYSNTYAKWNTQSMTCHMYGGQLLTINDASKETQVSNFLTDMSLVSTNNVYVGLTNIIGSSSDWIWSNTGTVSWDNWNSGYPVSTNRYNCGYIKAGNPDLKWFNELCLRDYQAICERPSRASEKA